MANNAVPPPRDGAGWDLDIIFNVLRVLLNLKKSILTISIEHVSGCEMDLSIISRNMCGLQLFEKRHFRSTRLEQ